MSNQLSLQEKWALEKAYYKPKGGRYSKWESFRYCFGWRESNVHAALYATFEMKRWSKREDWKNEYRHKRLMMKPTSEWHASVLYQDVTEEEMWEEIEE